MGPARIRGGGGRHSARWRARSRGSRAKADPAALARRSRPTPTPRRAAAAPRPSPPASPARACPPASAPASRAACAPRGRAGGRSRPSARAGRRAGRGRGRARSGRSGEARPAGGAEHDEVGLPGLEGGRRGARRCRGARGCGPATRISTAKTAPQRYRSVRIGTSSQSAISPGKGTRPSRKREWALGTKRRRKGPTSATAGALPGPRSTSTICASGTPEARQSVTADRDPKTAGRGGDRDGGDVEDVVEVGVADDDGVGARGPARDGGGVGAEGAREAAGEGGAGQVRVEEEDEALVLEGEARGAEPADAHGAAAQRAPPRRRRSRRSSAPSRRGSRRRAP